MNFNGCTCGPYSSVIPPEPCPIHDPERAYWRMRLLREFGGEYGTSTTTTSTIIDGTIRTNSIPTYEPPVPPKADVHYNAAPSDSYTDDLVCGADARVEGVRWARIPRWVSCEFCLREMDSRED